MSRFRSYLITVLVIFASVGSFVIINTRFDTKTAPENKQIHLTQATPTIEAPHKVATTSEGIGTITIKAPANLATQAKSAQKSAQPSKTVVAVSHEQTAVSEGIPLDTVSSSLRNALVNIICYAPSASNLRSISGSGVIIDPKGIILTNAHIAEYFLLADRGVSCVIRSGSPATTKYEASLIYISPTWIHENATVLSQAEPKGTGEYDFALLAITKSKDVTPLPSPFPFISLAEGPVTSYEQVVIASYGAQFLDFSQIQNNLSPLLVFGSIKDVFTFSKESVDVLALGGSVAAQEGSSGGGVSDSSGMLIGTITTSTVTGATDTRALSAITASYIRAEYFREMSTTLESLLNEPIVASVANFAPQVPILESILIKK